VSNRDSIPLLLASIRDPHPSTTTDWAMPCTFKTTVRSSVVLAPMTMSFS
jgi:hypothetical protein